jgi:hypothetical protein
VKDETRAYYQSARFADLGAKWPPSEAELILQLRSAVLHQPMPAKTRPFPLATAWGNLLAACRRALVGTLLGSDGPDIFAALAGAFPMGGERDALVRVIVERAPCCDDHPFARETSWGDGSTQIDWTAGLPGALTSARMLRALGLLTESDDLAHEAWQWLIDLVLGFRRQPGEVGVRGHLAKTLAWRPFERAAFPAMQVWVDAHVPALLEGRPVPEPPLRNGGFEQLFERLRIEERAKRARKAPAPKAAAPPPDGYVDWDDVKF